MNANNTTLKGFSLKGLNLREKKAAITILRKMDATYQIVNIYGEYTISTRVRSEKKWNTIIDYLKRTTGYISFN